MYTQVEYCLERVPALVKAKPELANVEPFARSCRRTGVPMSSGKRSKANTT
jgi:hypothetical protein